MFNRIKLMAVLATLALAAPGCVGAYDPGQGEGLPSSGGTGNPELANQFMSTVSPTLNAKCAGPACHNGGAGEAPARFLGDTATSDDYEFMKNFPSVHGQFNVAAANLVQKVEGGNHYGTSYSPAELDAITAWLDAERAALTGEEQLPVVSNDPLQTLAGCMTIDDWNASQMGEWSNKGSNQGQCQACHADGLARFNTNPNNDTMFVMNGSELYAIGFFTGKVSLDPDAPPVPVVAMEKLIRMGNGTTGHPEYNTNANDPHFLYLADFAERVEAKRLAGECGPPVYMVP